MSLIVKIIESTLNKFFFDIRYQNKLYNEQSKNQIIKFEQGDTIHLIRNNRIEC